MLKALEADFVWIANPIVLNDHLVDLVHCTAPRYNGKKALPYRLLPHHESGEGVSVDAQLPVNEIVSLVRIGDQLQRVAIHVGRTEETAKMTTCHTQIRVKLESETSFLQTLMGTHVVLTFGDFRREIRYLCRFLYLEFLS